VRLIFRWLPLSRKCCSPGRWIEADTLIKTARHHEHFISAKSGIEKSPGGYDLRIYQRKRSLELPNNLARMLFQILLSRCLRLNFFVFPTTNRLDQAADRSSVLGAEGATARTSPHRNWDCSEVPGISRIPGVQNRKVAASAQLTGAPIFRGIRKASRLFCDHWCFDHFRHGLKMTTKFRFPSHYSRQLGPSGIRNVRRLHRRRHIRNQAPEAIRATRRSRL